MMKILTFCKKGSMLLLALCLWISICTNIGAALEPVINYQLSYNMDSTEANITFVLSSVAKDIEIIRIDNVENGQVIYESKQNKAEFVVSKNDDYHFNVIYRNKGNSSKKKDVLTISVLELKDNKANGAAKKDSIHLNRELDAKAKYTLLRDGEEVPFGASHTFPTQGQTVYAYIQIKNILDVSFVSSAMPVSRDYNLALQI